MKVMKKAFWKIMLLGSVSVLTIPLVAAACGTTSDGNGTKETKDNNAAPVAPKNNESSQAQANEKKTATQLKAEYYSASDAYSAKLKELSDELKKLKDKLSDKKTKEAEKATLKEQIKALSNKAQQELLPLVDKYNKLFDELRMAQKAEQTEVRTIKFYHSNDEHGRIEFDDGRFSKYSGMVRTSDYLKGKKHDILVSAGDMIQGLPLSDSDKGTTIVKMAKNMGYDAVAVGNHEFDYGLDHILKLNKDSSTPDSQGRKMPFLSANVYYKDLATEAQKPEGYKQENVGKRVFEPYIIKELKNGMKAAIFGITTPDTVYTSHPRNSVLVEFKDPVESSKKVIQEIKTKHPEINFFVALTHLGTGRNTAKWSSEYLAQNIGGDLDLIIDGHSHTYVEINNSVNQDIYVTQTQAYTKYFGDIEIDFNVKTGKIVSVKQVLRNINQIDIATMFLEENANDENHKLLKNIKTAFGEDGKKELFTLSKNLTQTTTLEIGNVPYAIGRSTPTSLGVFAANAGIWATLKSNFWTNHAGYEAATIDNTIGLFNSGGLRANLSAGAVTKQNMLAVSPFGDRLVALRLKGSNLVKALQHGISKGGSGGFAQLSLNFSYQADVVNEKNDPKTNKPGYVWKPKTETFKINDKAIEADKYYYIATNDFLSAGGDGYTMLNYSNKANGVELAYEGSKFIDSLIEYAQLTTDTTKTSTLVNTKGEYSIDFITTPSNINTKQVINIPQEALTNTTNKEPKGT